MLYRATKFLLLACIAFWATGAAQCIHELVEHGEHDAPPALFQASEPARPGDSSHEHRDGRHHDHDDCPTCQLLAHMNAERVAPPALVCVHLPLLITLPLNDWRRPIVDSHCFAPIRGPPAAAAFPA